MMVLKLDTEPYKAAAVSPFALPCVGEAPAPSPGYDEEDDAYAYYTNLTTWFNYNPRYAYLYDYIYTNYPGAQQYGARCTVQHALLCCLGLYNYFIYGGR